jgi:hypothetical protein
MRCYYPICKKNSCIIEEKEKKYKTTILRFAPLTTKRVNIEVLENHFDVGYEARGEYHFDSKKLFAKHYEHHRSSGS